MNTRPILYFAEGGAQHSQAVLQAAKERAVDLRGVLKIRSVGQRPSESVVGVAHD